MNLVMPRWNPLPKLVSTFWRTVSGGVSAAIKCAVCYFIQDLSSGGFPLLDAVVDRWLKALRECLASADSNVQQSAISAVTALIGEYFRHQPVEKLTALLNHFLPGVTSNNQQARVGNALTLGSMPRFLLTVSLPKVIQQLCTCALITDKTLQWAESRKNALTALSLVCTTVGIAPSSPGGVDQVTLAGIFRTFIDGFEDYTVDSRGDIGAIVRESAMYSIQVLTNTSQPDLLEADLIRSVLHAVAKQSTEQIRRNRLLAPNVFLLSSTVIPPFLTLSSRKNCVPSFHRLRWTFRPRRNVSICG
ncbi:tubulin-specific chaperone D-like isoform X2 [Daphnia pulicaria]|nr:tubulin-specific chaperone D-like isoform X2 [Daphnia pulicaria]XP_046633041.1 tubulin-specific chaperone D-like isoform X2 [Daphnia pulicaria]XP_046633042.1 tubulin-specific chaperone D-like isoform X2 [Daphnia pulicaria]